MSSRPMQGVKVVEVAQFTYVPSAGATLADWGATVYKIEHATMGDAQRGMVGYGPAGYAEGSFSPIMEHANRGKRGIALDIGTPAGLAVLYRMVEECDVFLTNFLPDARERLHIDVEHIRAVNPSIIYARGSAIGHKGEESRNGGFDSASYWCRGGGALGTTPAELKKPLNMPAPAHGDTLGGLTIAGGVAAALFQRATTGEPSVVDVSLLGVGAYACGLSVDISLMSGEPWAWPPNDLPGAPVNPIVGPFETADEQWIYLAMLQAGRYWADFCRHVQREDLIDDPRFDTAEKIVANAQEGAFIVADVLRTRTLAEWIECFETLEGQWTVIQDSVQVGQDTQLRAMGYFASVTDADGTPRELITNPVQFDETPAVTTRAPQFSEHTDEVLAEFGYTEEEILQLKIDGAAT